MLCSQIPYFNAPIYLENKNDVGKVRSRGPPSHCPAAHRACWCVTPACLQPCPKVDEIFGTIQEVYFSVKPAEGVNAPSFKVGDKLYINPEKLLPLARFLPGAQGGGGGGGKGKGGKGATWTSNRSLMGIVGKSAPPCAVDL